VLLAGNCPRRRPEEVAERAPGVGVVPAHAASPHLTVGVTRARDLLVFSVGARRPGRLALQRNHPGLEGGDVGGAGDSLSGGLTTPEPAYRAILP
jgi:hypothetical protein